MPREGIAQFQPQAAAVLDYSGQATADQTHLVNPQLNVRLQSDLVLHAIVAEHVIRRAGDDTVDRLRRKCPELLRCTADQNGISFESAHDSLSSCPAPPSMASTNRSVVVTWNSFQ